LLAGRKLLLADDSITIQKVVALTFADEGVEVVTVSDGNEAVEKLEELAPDIILADIFMPTMSGYEVCEYVKQNAKLKHIPVMLLVGSFEPLDEAEARRVGADDILTKPFRSIRRLIDKVGELVGSKPPADEVPTAELPAVKEEPAEIEKLSTDELEIVTADTQPLPHASVPEEYKQVSAQSSQTLWGATHKSGENLNVDTTSAWGDERSTETGDVLLELDEIGQTPITDPDEFVLDIDLDDIEPEPAYEVAAAAGTHAFVDPQLSEPAVVGWELKKEEARFSEASRTKEQPSFMHDQMAQTQDWTREAGSYSSQPEESAQMQRVTDEPEAAAPTSVSAGQINAEQLSPEVIDAIARRAVAHLSERVVQEIAWEVVPDLAELLIKRKLEESQPK